MDKPLENFSDELISAYLDGELTADEQARVEQVLADSEQYRQIVEELRALRDSMQSLPRYQLADDFPQRVLRKAERQVLAGDGQASGSVTPPPPREPTGATGTWRGGVWAWAAIAAAVLLALFLPDRPRVQPIVQAPTEPSAAASNAASDDTAADAVGVSTERRAGSAVVRQEAEQADRSQQAEKRQPVGFEADSKRLEAAKMRATRNRAERASPAPAIPAGSMGRANQSPARDAVLDRVQLAEGASDSPTATHVAKSAPATSLTLKQAASDGRLVETNQRVAEVSRLTDPQFVVELAVAPEILLARTFDDSLNRNGIMLDPASDFRDVRKSGLDRRGADTAGNTSSARRQLAATGANRELVTPGVDIVCVEATPDQIEATLADFRTRLKQPVSLKFDSQASLESKAVRPAAADAAAADAREAEDAEPALEVQLDAVPHQSIDPAPLPATRSDPAPGDEAQSATLDDKGQLAGGAAKEAKAKVADVLERFASGDFQPPDTSKRIDGQLARPAQQAPAERKATAGASPVRPQPNGFRVQNRQLFPLQRPAHNHHVAPRPTDAIQNGAGAFAGRSTLPAPAAPAGPRAASQIASRTTAADKVRVLFVLRAIEAPGVQALEIEASATAAEEETGR